MRTLLISLVFLFLSGCVGEIREGYINKNIQNIYLSSVSITNCFGGVYGSGIIVHNKVGHKMFVLTAAHVVSGNHEICAQPIFDGRERRMRRYKSDEKLDLALVCGSTSEPKTGPSVLMSLRTPNIGDPIISIGSVKSKEGTVTNGIISNFEVSEEGIVYYKATAEIYHGSSGGGLFNANGELIGVACMTRRYAPFGFYEIAPGHFFFIGLETIRKFM